MALMMRHRWTWTGFTGAPGYSTFYALGTDANAFALGIKTFLLGGIANGAGGPLPSGVTLTPDDHVDVIQDTDGSLDSTQGVTGVAAIPGAGTATYGSPMGLVVSWQTNGIATGPSGKPRKVRGKTFLVPLSGASFDNNGTFDNTKLGTLNAAAAVFVSGSWNSCIWHRPWPKGGTNGSSHRITSGASRDKAAILTSRRD